MLTYLGEDESLELFSKVLDHVVSLGFTVDKQVETALGLEVDRVLNLSFHGLFVPTQDISIFVPKCTERQSCSLLLCDLALGKLGSSLSNLLGLRERSDSCSWEFGQVEVFLLRLSSSGKGRLSLEHLVGNLGHSVSDSRVRSPLEFTSSSDILGVLLEQCRFLAVQSLSKRSNLFAFLLCK